MKFFRKNSSMLFDFTHAQNTNLYTQNIFCEEKRGKLTYDGGCEQFVHNHRLRRQHEI